MGSDRPSTRISGDLFSLRTASNYTGLLGRGRSISPRSAVNKLFVYLYDEDDKFRPLQPRAFSSKLKRVKKAELKMETRHVREVLSEAPNHLPTAVRPSGIRARERDRPISHVVRKLTAWAELYNGVFEDDKNGGETFRRYTLEQAAQLLSISRRSLDDYLV